MDTLASPTAAGAAAGSSLFKRFSPWIILAYSAFMSKISWLGRHQLPHKQNFMTLWSSVLPSEYSQHLLFLNAAVAKYVWERRPQFFRSIAGYFAAVLWYQSTRRFLNIFIDSFRARMYFRDTLLSAGIISSHDPTLGSINSPERLASLIVPIPQILSTGVARKTGVVFATLNKCQLKMDVYKHFKCRPNAPVLVYIHGGGWVLGDRRTLSLPMVYEIARKGWVVCSIDYRLSPRVPFPEHLIDCKRAIAFLRQEGKKFLKINPDQIHVAGESAGGHLALLMALTANDPQYQPGFESVDTYVRGCIDIYGVHDLTDKHGHHSSKDNEAFVKYMQSVVMQKSLRKNREAWEAGSPYYLVSKTEEREVPPIMTIHGALDTLVPVGDSREFHAELREARQKAGQTEVNDVYVELPGAHHAFQIMPSVRTFACADAAAAFLNYAYNYASDTDRPTASNSNLAVATLENDSRIAGQDTKELDVVAQPDEDATSTITRAAIASKL